MPLPRKASAVLTLRIPERLDRDLAHEARRRRRTKSAVVREILESAMAAGGRPPDPARETRRQSLLVSGRASEKEALDFVSKAADRRGWR